MDCGNGSAVHAFLYVFAREVRTSNSVREAVSAGPTQLFQKLKLGLPRSIFQSNYAQCPLLQRSSDLTQAGQVEGPYIRALPHPVRNIQRDALWGPHLINVDLSLAKRFTLAEWFSFQLMAQAFNVFNHPNYEQPNVCVDCGTSFRLDHGHCGLAGRLDDAAYGIYSTLPILSKALSRKAECWQSYNRTAE